MVLSRLDKTGMTTHTIDLADALSKEGINVTVCVGYVRGDKLADELMDRLSQTGATIKKFHFPAHKSTLFSKIRSFLSLSFYILSCKGSIIHIQSPYLSWIPWILGKRFISTLHVNDLVKCFYYKKADELIAISRETKQYAIDQFGYSSSNITIVHHGVSDRYAQVLSLNERDNQRIKLGLPTDKLLLLIVGSIEPRKGQHILLQAIDELPDVIKDKIHVILLGSDKTDSHSNDNWLNEWIKKTNTSKYISRFEYADSSQFYKIADINILPSELEGFGLVIIEGMLSGNLCIRSDAEGAYDTTIDGKTGFIFPKGDFQQLSKILKEVITDDNLRKTIAANGRDYALSHFKSENMAKNTISVYRKLKQL